MKVILLVEDSLDDELLFRQVVQKIVANPVLVVRDGHDAIAYLDGQGIYADRQKYPMPSVLLLDLKLPKVDGFEVLTWLKTRPDLSSDTPRT